MRWALQPNPRRGKNTVKIRFLFALWIAKACALALRIFAPSRGTNLSGAIACRLCPRFVSQFSGIDLEKTIFLTGTNGKSTTNNMVVHALRCANKKVATNLAGANLLAGVATALLRDATALGRVRAEYVVMETDERFLPIIHAQLPARHLCITNLQKDQVQRNGDPDTIVRKIKSVIDHEHTTLYLNNEEPRSSALAPLGRKAVFYGVARNELSFCKHGEFDVAVPCPVCAGRIAFSHYNIDNIGPFACASCAHKSQEQPDVLLRDIDFDSKTFTCGETVFQMNYTAAHFLYSYAPCIAVCRAMGIGDETLQQAFASFTNIGGRMETIAYRQKRIQYIRMKQENPETVQSALNDIARDKTQKVFLLGLDELQDFWPHYCNTFYAFDCNFEGLVQSGVERYICFSKTVAYDTANRLIYAGADPQRITILPTDEVAPVFEALASCESDNAYLITWLKKYHDMEQYAKAVKA